MENSRFVSIRCGGTQKEVALENVRLMPTGVVVLMQDAKKPEDFAVLFASDVDQVSYS